MTAKPHIFIALGTHLPIMFSLVAVRVIPRTNGRTSRCRVDGTQFLDMYGGVRWFELPSSWRSAS